MRGRRGCGRIVRRRGWCFARGSRLSGSDRFAGLDMDAWRFILASLRHYRRIHLAVALGVAVATAVLTGALLVGDSVRGSLRDLTLQRLGRIDSVIVSPNFFREKLAHEIVIWPGHEGNGYSPETQPAILLNGTLQSGAGQVHGVRLRFR